MRAATTLIVDCISCPSREVYRRGVNGKPLSEGFASLRSANNDSYSVNLGETGGAFTFDLLPEGNYDLSISGAGGKSLHSQKLMLTAGVTTKDIDL